MPQVFDFSKYPENVIIFFGYIKLLQNAAKIGQCLCMFVKACNYCLFIFRARGKRVAAPLGSNAFYWSSYIGQVN